jgi:hypothetical protein
MEKNRKIINLNIRTVTASIRNFAVSHPRLLTIGIYAGVALAISVAMGSVLYPEQQQAFAVRKFEGWW